MLVQSAHNLVELDFILSFENGEELLISIDDLSPALWSLTGDLIVISSASTTNIRLL